MLKVCIVVDVEGFLSFKQGNPSWSLFEKFKGLINNLIRYTRYDKNGFDRIYGLVRKYKFPASFMLVGSLFKPKSGSLDYIDWGYHTLNHKPLTLISDYELKEEIKNIYNAVSFSAPMWMIEDVNNPERIFKALKEEGYKIAVYKGKNNGIKSMQQSQISDTTKKGGIKCVYQSNWFDGERKYKIKGILRDIINNTEKRAVYCITTHDFSNKNLENFEILIKKLKEMEDKGMIKIVNLKQLDEDKKN